MVMSSRTTATVIMTTKETISAMLRSLKYLQSPSASLVHRVVPMLILAKVIESSASHNKGRKRTQQCYCFYKIARQLSGPSRGMATTSQDGSVCELDIPKTTDAACLITEIECYWDIITLSDAPFGDS